MWMPGAFLLFVVYQHSPWIHTNNFTEGKGFSPGLFTWAASRLTGAMGKGNFHIILFKTQRFFMLDNGCGLTRRVNKVYFSETSLKILNNLTRLKVRYNKITGLHFISGRTEMTS